MIVFFYSNEDTESQRVATLVKYVALEYSKRIDFRRVEAAPKGKPDARQARELEGRFSLDATPGILFYDNHDEKMILEKEGYVHADYKEFRTPLMLLWNTYYAAVRKELDRLLAE
jgi:thioredoxin-related protein